jgi:CubicO group peptidase (beta-lactamase class C family)
MLSSSIDWALRGATIALVLLGEPPAAVSLPAHTPAPALLPDIAGPQVVEPDQPALKQALDRAFAEAAAAPYRNTKAVVVVRDGRVIAERYAPGLRHRHAGDRLVGHQVQAWVTLVPLSCGQRSSM